MIDPHCLQAQKDVDRLVEPKEIGAAPPFIQGGDNVCADLSLFLRRVELLPAVPFPLEDNAPVRRYAYPNLVVARPSDSGLKRLAAR